MGNEGSTMGALNQLSELALGPAPGPSGKGYHVIKVQPDSPAAEAGLQSYFDHIVAANGLTLDKEDTRFVEMLRDSTDKPMALKVFNTKSGTMREVTLTPHSRWGGQGTLGVTIRFSTWDSVNEFVWHVLDVYPDSPAEDAGLEPWTDYIVGSPEQVFRHEDNLKMLLLKHLGSPVQLYVYSKKSDAVREVTIIPSREWPNAKGVIGCDIGFGFMHRIPNAADGVTDADIEGGPPPESRDSRAVSAASTTTAPAAHQQAIPKYAPDNSVPGSVPPPQPQGSAVAPPPQVPGSVPPPQPQGSAVAPPPQVPGSVPLSSMPPMPPVAGATALPPMPSTSTNAPAAAPAPPAADLVQAATAAPPVSLPGEPAALPPMPAAPASVPDTGATFPVNAPVVPVAVAAPNPAIPTAATGGTFAPVPPPPGTSAVGALPPMPPMPPMPGALGGLPPMPGQPPVPTQDTAAPAAPESQS